MWVPPAHNALLTTDFDAAVALHRQGRLKEALDVYGRILSRTPSDVRTLSASGLALHQMGLDDEAVQRLDDALRVDRSRSETWSYLSLVFQAQGRLPEALQSLQQAIRCEPDAAALWNNLSGLHLALGRADEAEVASLRATTLAPNDGSAWFNLALSLQAAGKRQSALDAAVRAAKLAPDVPSPHGLKAQLEAQLGRLDSASATIAAAIARHPDVAPLLLQGAEIALARQDLPSAARFYDRALVLEPGNGAALSQLVFLRKRLADWRGLGLLRQRFRAGVRDRQPALTPFCFLSDPSTRAEQRRCAERWSDAFVSPGPVAPRRPFSEMRLRVGYLSADFHQHATAVLAAGLFEAHDPERFVVTAYSTGPDDGSPMRARLEKAFTQFVDARDWPTDRLVARIRADRIDILIDLKGHTDNARTDVVAQRPAPIQVSYLGYPGTMGAPFIDYLVGDRVVTPLEHAADYSETLVLLPASYQVNDAARPIGEPPCRARLGLPETDLVFCCFNSAFKFNPEVFDAWARILQATPRAVLWLLATSSAGSHDACADNLRREASARGVNPARLVFAERKPYPEYLGLYQCADLFLDTWPYNAHTTASDALWAGCPVLTPIGDTFAGRVGASLLAAVGLPKLIAPNVERYIDQAIALAADRPALADHRAYLCGAGRRSSLFDTIATTRALETAYAEMAAQHRRGTRAPIIVSTT
jgi:protein O-GlcNAc transferase